MPPTQPRKNPPAQKPEQHHLLDHLVRRLSKGCKIQEPKDMAVNWVPEVVGFIADPTKLFWGAKHHPGDPQQ